MLLFGQEFREAAAAFPNHAATAIHEAAHCVAARHFGRAPKAVALDDDGRGGCVWIWPSASSPTAVRQTLVILAAGEVAAAHYANQRPGKTDDQREIASEARRLVGLLAAQSVIDLEIRQARDRAERLVRKLWDHITPMAQLLLQFHATASKIPTGPLEDLNDRP